jgi:asparagine synthase (glutamine-hydrolysing)
MEEPVHAPDLLPDYVIRKELARQGFKVGLSGIGGDELFAGYEHYRWLRVHDLQRSGHRLRALGEIVLSSQTSPPAALWRLLRSRLPRVRPATDLYRDAVGPPSEGVTPPDNCEDRLRADLEWALLPYWLRAGDKSCMAAPIEVRYPFLDHRLLEFSTRLPVVHLIRRGWLKWLLRTAMEGTLPRSVTWRRKKMGFPFPIKSWLLEERSRLRQVFGESDNPWIDRRFWLHRLAEAIDADPWLVWRAFSLELWHRRFIRRVSVFPEAVDAA